MCDTSECQKITVERCGTVRVRAGYYTAMEINSLYSVPLFGLASISENTNHDYVVCMYPAHTLQTSLSRYTHYYNAMNDHTEKSDTFH